MIPALFAAFCTLLFPVLVQASDYDSFSRDIAKPYGFYKKALSLTSKKEGMEKAKEQLVHFEDGWAKVLATYGDDAPRPFAGMQDYAARMRRPLEVSKKAMAHIQSGDHAKAHTALEEIRYILWEMRISSGIVSLNDRVNDFHEAMEVVLDKAGAAKNADELKQVGQRYGMWLAIKWEEIGMAKDYGSEEKTFLLAVKEGHEAVRKLNAALSMGEADAVKKAGGDVKEAYKKLFFLPL